MSFVNAHTERQAVGIGVKIAVIDIHHPFGHVYVGHKLSHILLIQHFTLLSAACGKKKYHY